MVWNSLRVFINSELRKLYSYNMGWNSLQYITMSTNIFIDIILKPQNASHCESKCAISRLIRVISISCDNERKLFCWKKTMFVYKILKILKRMMLFKKELVDLLNYNWDTSVILFSCCWILSAIWLDVMESLGIRSAFD